MKIRVITKGRNCIKEKSATDIFAYQKEYDFFDFLWGDYSLSDSYAAVSDYDEENEIFEDQKHRKVPKM